jgi:hypothetical protein
MSDGLEVLTVMFDVVDLEAKGDQNLQDYQDSHNVERRAISKLFDRHGRKIVHLYYVHAYSQQFPLHEVARLTLKIAEEGPKEPKERVWNYEAVEARFAKLEDYHNQYCAATEQYDWAECRRILVEAQAKAWVHV